MYPCFYSNHWFSSIVAVFGADGYGCGVNLKLLNDFIY